MTRIPLFPVPQDGPADVHVWRVDIRFDTTLDSDTFAALSRDERTQARVFHRSEDALRFATVRAALLKTTGVGVVRGLQRLTVLPRDGVRVALRDEVPDEAHDLAATWLAAPAGYAACVAWSMTSNDPD